MKKKSGFTLIELVVVIVVIAILAVVAIPKFLNYQRDAKIALLNGAEATLKAANDMVYAKATLEGKQNLMPREQYNDVESWLIINGTRVDLSLGHILANPSNIRTVANFPESEWHMAIERSGHFGSVYLVPKGTSAFDDPTFANVTASKCYFNYYFDRGVYQPSYKVESSGC